jgi:hypothetical protein
VPGGGHQPYKRGLQRQQGPALERMLAGEGTMGNPQDVKRQAQKQVSGTEAKSAPVQSRVLAEFAAKHMRLSD